jgi:hypothetical protein
VIEVVGDAGVPPPKLLTVTFCEAGFVPPAVALKLRLAGESEMVGMLPGALLIIEREFSVKLLVVALVVSGYGPQEPIDLDVMHWLCASELNARIVNGMSSEKIRVIFICEFFLFWPECSCFLAFRIPVCIDRTAGLHSRRTGDTRLPADGSPHPTWQLR